MIAFCVVASAYSKITVALVDVQQMYSTYLQYNRSAIDNIIFVF